MKLTKTKIDGIRYIRKNLDVRRHENQYWYESAKMYCLLDNGFVLFKCRKTSVITFEITKK